MIQKVAILGQGSMGSSITQHAANCGFNVVLWGRNPEKVAAAAEAKKAAKAAKKAGDEAAIAETKAAQKAAEAAAQKSEYDAIYGKAVEVAKQLCKKPARALESVKKVIYDAVNVNAQQGKLMETAEFALLFNTHDQREGMTAFGEKRDPVYTNN